MRRRIVRNTAMPDCRCKAQPQSPYESCGLSKACRKTWLLQSSGLMEFSLIQQDVCLGQPMVGKLNVICEHQSLAELKASQAWRPTSPCSAAALLAKTSCRPRVIHVHRPPSFTLPSAIAHLNPYHNKSLQSHDSPLICSSSKDITLFTLGWPADLRFRKR